ncbi:Phospholipase D1, partial [Ascosphaera pollenicola]
MSFLRRSKGSNKEEEIMGIEPIQSQSSEENGAYMTANLDEKGFADPTAKETKEEQVARTIEEFRKAHKWDMNMDDETLEGLARTAVERDITGGIDAIAKIMDDSPYPEVRAAVRNYDEDLPCNTIRMWAIGMILNTLGSGMNSLFSLRAPSISITPIVIQLVAYPCGKFWAWVMPNHEFNTFGVKWNLNPGPFNLKEHAAIVIMANAAFGGGVGYFTDTLTAQKIWYKQDLGVGWDICFALSTQMVGFAISGLMRRWLVEA